MSDLLGITLLILVGLGGLACVAWLQGRMQMKLVDSARGAWAERIAQEGCPRCDTPFDRDAALAAINEQSAESARNRKGQPDTFSLTCPCGASASFNIRTQMLSTLDDLA